MVANASAAMGPWLDRPSDPYLGAVAAKTVRASSSASVAVASDLHGPQYCHLVDQVPGSGTATIRPSTTGGPMATTPPLHGMRIIECSALGPAQITTPLIDLGAEVIKVEPPSGDYVREMTWPIVEGVSLMHLHLNRGKRSLVLDLRSDAGVAIMKELAATADAVVEAMRPGSLARRGVGYDDLRVINPKIVFCTISGYGMTGPYRDYPSHGIAYDTWAGIVNVATDEEGFTYIPEHASIGITRRPALRRARHPGRGHPGTLDRARARTSTSPSPTRPPRWTGCARRPGVPTSGPSPR